MSVLRERHALSCPCSICGGLQHAGARSFGLLTPLDKVWNGWRWLFVVTATARHYVRWTGFWQKHPSVGPRR